MKEAPANHLQDKNLTTGLHMLFKFLLSYSVTVARN